MYFTANLIQNTQQSTTDLKHFFTKYSTDLKQKNINLII